MTFTSLEFVVFFPLIVLLYNLVPKKIRLLYLLVTSYLIYGLLQPSYLFLLIATSLVTYSFGMWMDNTDDDDRKHRIMQAGIVLILAPLFLFKYFNFVDESIMSMLSTIGIHVTLPTIRWMLPLGISYYTFMSIGYLVDLYNEEVEVEKNPFSLCLFLSFFPIVFSGPIERAGNMLPQISKMNHSTSSDLLSGFRIMLWGYFMKLCVADRLGIIVTDVYSNLDNYNGACVAFASLLFPLQEYGDLGGYSLIAIGSARCMGFQIIPNFRRPFFATSISAFWRRWHMSLIQWLTDYIYTPMNYTLRSWKSWGVVGALMITFLVSGIWHGATTTCVVWGIMQGILLSIESMMIQKRTAFEVRYNLPMKWWYNLFCIIGVYLIFALSEIYGMSDSFEHANNIIARIFTGVGTFYSSKREMAVTAMLVLLLLIKDFKDEKNMKIHFLNSNNRFVYLLSALAILLLIYYYGASTSTFIYYQF